jgi:hypothetical protein
MSLDDKTIAKTWRFKSNSNPDKTYETIQYTDGTTSCQCKGWIIKKEGRERECTHTRMVENGLADSHCVPGSIIDRTQKTRAPGLREQVRAPKGRTDKPVLTKIPTRKILW